MSKSRGRNSHQKRELKHQLISKRGYLCRLCNKSFSFDCLTLDHIIPLTHNGSWDITNLQLACYKCNQEKGDNYDDPWANI